MLSNATPNSGLSSLRVAFFAAVVGIFIFNVFASQVVVANIAAGLGLAASRASLIPTFTALGYALGLLLVVPLADVVENRRLVLWMALVCVGALLLAAASQQAVAFLALCFIIGAASSLIQILVPLVGALTPAAHRGRVLGNVMSGLMLGIMACVPKEKAQAGARISINFASASQAVPDDGEGSGHAGIRARVDRR